MNDRTIAIISLGAVSVASSLLLLSMMKSKRRLCSCRNTVKNKVIVITGANRGIGFEAAIQLASYGAKVYLCCRDETLGEKAAVSIRKKTKNSQVHFVPLDLLSLNSCSECVTLLFLREAKVDILIHNAAVFHTQPKLTQDGFEVNYQTNFLGPVALTEKILPLLLESLNPRVIFTSSEAHKIPSLEEVDCASLQKTPNLRDFDAYAHHYGKTKLALKLYAGYLADINKSSPFIVASVNPGNVWTGIYRNCWKRWFNWPMRLLCYFSMRNPCEGAQSIIHAANASDLRNGSYIHDCQEEFSFVSDEEVRFGKRFVDEVFDLLNIK